MPHTLASFGVGSTLADYTVTTYDLPMTSRNTTHRGDGTKRNPAASITRSHVYTRVVKYRICYKHLRNTFEAVL